MTRGDPLARSSDTALTVLVHVLGVVAFGWPFVVGVLDDRGRASPHAGDAPLLFTAFGALLVVIAVAEVRAGTMTTKHLALLGVLAGVNAILRLPGAFAGASLMFVLPIVCGAALGARFGFLLGAISMAASGVITGGVGPWLPFQMWALGWVGAGAAVLRPLGASRTGLWALVVYGWLAGMVFGALVNLWFWPFQSGESAVAWQPGLSAPETAVRYWRFYVLTSLAWDASRALANAVLLAVLGKALLRTLTRFRARLDVTWDPSPVVPRAEVARASTMGS